MTLQSIPGSPSNGELVAYETALATTRTYATLSEAFHYFNDRMGLRLSHEPLITFQRSRSRGYFRTHAFKGRGHAGIIDEIALNPEMFDGRSDADILSTLLHEMVHQWQFQCGTPSRGGYHNREWADQMESVGLMPSSTAAPGGKRTGPRVTHYIIPGGRFATLAATVLTRRQIEWQAPAVFRIRDASKQKYTCGSCKSSAWGKFGLHLVCGDCDTKMGSEL